MRAASGKEQHLFIMNMFPDELKGRTELVFYECWRSPKQPGGELITAVARKLQRLLTITLHSCSCYEPAVVASYCISICVRFKNASVYSMYDNQSNSH